MSINCEVNTGDTAWIITSSVLVLGMVPGLALFESGLLPAKHSLSIMMQVISGIMVLSVMWIIFGFSFTYGPSVKGIIGNPFTYALFINLRKGECLQFAPTIPGFVFAIFQMMFATITPLLMTGAFAGRLRFRAYFLFIIGWEILVYYPLAHWIWGDGWLSPRGNGLPAGKGVIDFAGGITIHTSAGVSSLVTAIMLGPRYDFHKNSGHYRPSNLTTALLGTTFLWLGWFGFNAGSALSAGSLATIAVANTQMAACISGLLWLLLYWWNHGKTSLVETLNGAIAGLAGITPASGFINPEWALLVGILLGLSGYLGVIILKKKWLIDDSLDVSVIHGLTGIVGSLSNGFFASTSVNPNGQPGLVDGHALQIPYQLLGVFVAAAWSILWTVLLLWMLDKIIGIRVSEGIEKQGLGYAEHGEWIDDYHYYKKKSYHLQYAADDMNDNREKTNNWNSPESLVTDIQCDLGVEVHNGVIKPH